MRYVYLGDRLTDPALVGQACDPVRRADGKCIVSQRMATQLVVFEDGARRVVLRRRLRVVGEEQTPTMREAYRCFGRELREPVPLETCRYDWIEPPESGGTP